MTMQLATGKTKTGLPPQKIYKPTLKRPRVAEDYDDVNDVRQYQSFRTIADEDWLFKKSQVYYSPSPPEFDFKTFKYKNQTTTSIAAAASQFITTPLNPNSLFRQDATVGTPAENFPFLLSFTQQYEKALVIRCKYIVTFTNSATILLRPFIIFNPYVNPNALPLTTWAQFDECVVTGTNQYWCTSCLLQAGGTAQSQQILQLDMYLPDQYGERRGYNTTVDAPGAIDFANTFPAAGGLPTGNPSTKLWAYVGYVTVDNTTTSVSLKCEINAELTTMLYRVSIDFQ